MIKKFVDETPLREFAEEAAAIPEPKRRQLEDELPWTWDDRHDTGIFVGLAIASEHSRRDGGEDAAHLRELATVAAARVLWQRLVLLSQTAEPGTPEFLAGMEAHIEGLRSGRIESIPADAFIREMETLMSGGKDSSPSNGLCPT